LLLKVVVADGTTSLLTHWDVLSSIGYLLLLCFILLLLQLLLGGNSIHIVAIVIFVAWLRLRRLIPLVTVH